MQTKRKRPPPPPFDPPPIPSTRSLSLLFDDLPSIETNTTSWPHYEEDKITPTKETKSINNSTRVELIEYCASLPSELWEHIITFLPISDVFSVLQVNPFLNKSLSSEHVWNRICNMRFSQSYLKDKDDSMSWKEFFLENLPKPRVLIIGGCQSLLGLYLIFLLCNNKLASSIVVADQIHYRNVFLSRQEQNVFSDERIKFILVDIKNSVVAKSLFEDGCGFDFVFNLNFWPGDSTKKPHKIAKCASRSPFTRYIHTSSALIYTSSTYTANEHSPIEPWCTSAVSHINEEKCLYKMKNLDYIIARPAMIYGKNGHEFFKPFLIASLYKDARKDMISMQKKVTKMSTVHAEDVARALWFLAKHGPKQSVWNLADKTNTDQGKIHQLIEEIFHIKPTFYSAQEMKFASIAAKTFNDHHYKMHQEMIKRYSLLDKTPLTPVVDEIFLLGRHCCIDGSAIEKLGFVYKYPQLISQSVIEVMEDFIEKKMLPSQNYKNNKLNNNLLNKKI